MSRKFVTSVGLLASSSNPSSPNTGDTYYNTTDNTIRVYTGTAWTNISGFIAQTAAPANTSLLWLDTDEPADTTVLSFNAQTGTAYTLGSGDTGNFVTLNNASAITVTVPPSVFTTGQIVNVQQIGTGQATFSQGSGVTITSTGVTSTAPKLRARYSSATVICTGSNTFTIVGDIS